MTETLKSIKAELRRRMREPIEQTGKRLERVVRGYFNHRAIPGNVPALAPFRQVVARYWRQTVLRSQRSRWTWERFEILAARYLPDPRGPHPHPMERFRGKHPG
jgi:hypothetical protein